MDQVLGAGQFIENKVSLVQTMRRMLACPTGQASIIADKGLKPVKGLSWLTIFL